MQIYLEHKKQKWIKKKGSVAKIIFPQFETIICTFMCHFNLWYRQLGLLHHRRIVTIIYNRRIIFFK
jgi:hypothetical protein